MNPDDLMITLDADSVYSTGSTIIDDSYWNDMADDPRDQEAFKSINDRLSTIENRLSILKPDTEMLEKYEVLQDIYKQYKAAEALLSGPDVEIE
tara:strand:- start:1617 stop:1898 length:282 start_codon:yes stop_codon:yes gene_type:complete